YDEVKNIGLFELTDGKVLSLEAVRKIRSPWTFAKPGSRVADQLMQIDAAICFSEDTTDRMDYSGELGSFFDWLLKRQGLKELEKWSKIRKFYSSFEILADGYSNAHRIIPTSKLSKAERRFLTVMERYDCWNGRTFCIGVSDTANGWTDGKTYIAFNRDYLKWNNPQYSSGAASLVTLAFHEMAHDEEDTGSHNHKVEFYQRYHDLTRNQALWLIADLPAKMRAQKWQDKASEEAERQAKKKEQRDRRLGIKRIGVAADVSKPSRLAKKLKGTGKKKAKRRKF
ncbi:MAG: hypothetical protein ACE5H1_08530, partial [Thermodesulfobacteriota bacterium]